MFADDGVNCVESRLQEEEEENLEISVESVI